MTAITDESQEPQDGKADLGKQERTYTFLVAYKLSNRDGNAFFEKPNLTVSRAVIESWQKTISEKHSDETVIVFNFMLLDPAEQSQ